MCSHLGDTTVVEYDDLVGISDRGQPVGNRDGRSALAGGVDRGLHGTLGLVVQCTRRLVEHEDSWITEQRARQRDSLLLAAGEPMPAGADEGVVSVGQCGDEVVDLRGPRCLLDLLIGSIGSGMTQIVANTRVQQVGLL